jgi:type II secretory pathway pseudopilin PulG
MGVIFRLFGRLFLLGVFTAVVAAVAGVLRDPMRRNRAREAMNSASSLAGDVASRAAETMRRSDDRGMPDSEESASEADDDSSKV